MKTKICSKCKKEKSIVEFHRDSSKRDGLRSSCKYCTKKQIKEYLSGAREKFDLKLDLKGSPFHLKAYKQAIRIPYGKTDTYGGIAGKIGSPRASRAVGSAMAKCRMPLVVPCHRVVASSGLGGYAGEESLKIRLLKMEGAKIK